MLIVNGKVRANKGRMKELAITNKDIFKKTELTLPENITEQETVDIGKALAKAESGVQWWIGDLWNVRQEKGWGCGPEFAEEIGVNYESAMMYGKIAGQCQFGLRRPN